MFRFGRSAWWALSLTLAFAAGWVARPAFSHAPAPAGAIYATPHPTPSGSPLADGVYAPLVTVHFSPRGGTRAAIIDCIDQASASVKVAMYSFTDSLLADALARAQQRGVTVEVVLDSGQQTARGGQAKRLSDAGVPVRFDTRSGLLHHKFAVVDGETVITGSHNWTESAEVRNAENIVVMRDSRLADTFAATFAALNSGQSITTDNQQGGM